jgi:polyphenol oxidase
MTIRLCYPFLMFFQKNRGSSSFCVFSELEEIPGLVHAFTTRLTDNSDKDAGRLPEVASGKQVLLDELQIDPAWVVQLKQIHSDRVVTVNRVRGTGTERARADGIVLTDPGHYAVIKTADCLPVIAVYPRGRQICALHAGWRGTSDRITEKAVGEFLSLTGAPPHELIVALGPSIRRCCYEVGQEVIGRFSQAGHELSQILSGRQLDIVQCNRLQLEKLGIRQILDSEMCTACRTDLFYSYRREGQTGRLWALAGFRE